MSGFVGGGGGSGVAGPQGVQGSPGVTGAVGNAGSVGNTGPTGAQGPTGTIGTTGPTGPIGAQGSPGINLQNAGASLGIFPTINLVGGLNGTTGPNNTVVINSITDFLQVGITGIGFTGSLQLASGPMVQWNTEKIRLGTIGHTTVGTAAGYLTINKSAYYHVNSRVNFTGLPSGVVIQSQEFISATGAFGGGTPISQSVAYTSDGMATGPSTTTLDASISKSYTVFIGSGTSIETYMNYLRTGGGSPIFMSQTGTFFEINSIGT
jgi:hypothetical protein